tara:strand:+ start:52 stop:636 length:585 start_codon:yes stop_codon:yes gene_type:complete
MAFEYESQLAVTDYRMIIRELNKIEPSLSRGFKKNFKSIAAPVREGIRDSIPSQPPHRGLRKVRSATGKTWNNRRNARTVLVKFVAPKTSATKALGILSLNVVSAATVMADFAGRGSSSINGRMTEPYEYHIRGVKTERKHKVNGQGKALIRALGKSPSRYIYPGAEKRGEEAREKFMDVVGDALKTIERETNG